MSSEAADPRDLVDVLGEPGRDPALFRRGRAGRGRPVREEVLFLELRIQVVSESIPHHDARQRKHYKGGDRRQRPADDPCQRRLVPALEPPHDGSVAAITSPGQEEQGQGRRDRQRDHHRHENRQRVREGEWLEERPGHALQEEDRDHGQHVDQGRVEDGASDLERGFEDDARSEPTSPVAALTKTPPDVLHVDDRVVHDHPDGDHQPCQDHRVDRVSAQVEHHQRRHQRKRDRDQADQRGTPLEQEGDQDQDHEQDAQEQREREVVDGDLDEVRLPEDVGIELNAGKAGLQIADRAVDAVGHLQRVRPRRPLHDEQEARAAVDDRVADERLVTLLHLRDVADANGLTCPTP